MPPPPARTLHISPASPRRPRYLLPLSGAEPLYDDRDSRWFDVKEGALHGSYSWALQGAWLAGCLAAGLDDCAGKVVASLGDVPGGAASALGAGMHRKRQGAARFAKACMQAVSEPDGVTGSSAPCRLQGGAGGGAGAGRRVAGGYAQRGGDAAGAEL